MKFRVFLLLAFALVALYFGVAAYVLRFEIDRLHFPHVGAAVHPVGLVLEAAAPSLSSALIVRLRSHWYLLATEPMVHSVLRMLGH